MISTLVRIIKWGRYPLLILVILLIGPFAVFLSNRIDLEDAWHTANRESAELAPSPQTVSEAVVQVYAARAFNWRGLFAVHMWIAVKPESSPHYVTYQVLGWRAYRGYPVVVSGIDIPDRYWYGNKPKVILDVRGPQAAQMIPNIQTAVDSYPYSNEYRVWPGPNSNTFIAHVGRQVPSLQLELPAHAVGKDYLPGATWFAPMPSGTGYHFSLFGLLGVGIAIKEGIELNILGLVFGIDFLDLAVKLPGIGQIGLR